LDFFKGREMTDLKKALENLKVYMQGHDGKFFGHIWTLRMGDLLKHYRPVSLNSLAGVAKAFRDKYQAFGPIAGKEAQSLLELTQDFIKEVEEYIAMFEERKKESDSITIAVAFDFSEAEQQMTRMLAQMEQAENSTLKSSLEESKKTVDALSSENQNLKNALKDANRGFASTCKGLSLQVRSWRERSDELAGEVKAHKQAALDLREQLRKAEKSSKVHEERARAWQEIANNHFGNIANIENRNLSLQHGNKELAAKVKLLELENRNLKAGKPTQNSFVLAYGSLKDGYSLVGPFPNAEAAEAYRKDDLLPEEAEILEVCIPAED
jgi:chromosome segregation ATPase